MSLLFRIVYAAHANGTHHKLALDGLRAMKGPDADAWTRLFLKHAARFMEGSKAPDDTFKDFKNHVLHVGDDYWGGAPEKVVEWYGATVAALKAQKWEDAVYAAGVLSHYYTDPVHPFHTGQTEAENAIHRAAEWSINRSYGVLRELGEARAAAVAVPVREGENWLKAMTCDGAEYSHRSYEKLIAHYDIHRGVTDPPSGLDGIARGLVAELLIYAATGFGRILDRAVAEAAVAPPEVSLTLDTIKAAIKIPAKMLAKRLTNAEDRAVVEAMYDELKATGKVDKTLPADDRTVRDLHAREVLAPREARQAAARNARMKYVAPAGPVIPPKVAAEIASRTEAALAGPLSSRQDVRVTPPAPPREQPPVQRHDQAAMKSPVKPAPPQAPARSAEPMAAKPAASPVPAAPAPAASLATPVAVAAQSLVARLADTPVAAAAIAPVATSVPSIEAPSGTDKAARVFLAAGDMLEAAPSIGPKMAERFAGFGIKTVADFLACNPAATAARFADRRIDGALLEQWQAQARLVMSIPGLRGTHAQLLTGAGLASAASVAAAEPAKVIAAVQAFAASTEGKRVLRDGVPPDAERIKAWVEAARQAAVAA